MADFRKAFLVLIAGCAAAFLITAFFVSHYGPSGRYALDRVLLKPEVLKQLNYNDLNPKINGQDRFVFDRIEFDSRPIDLKTYEKIYQVLAKDHSVDELPQLFDGNLSKIAIYVRTESGSSWQFFSKLIQVVEIADNDYRVDLHEDNTSTHFVYFHHENIKKTLRSLL